MEPSSDFVCYDWLIDFNASNSVLTEYENKLLTEELKKEVKPPWIMFVQRQTIK